MKKINELLKKYNINSTRYNKCGKCMIVGDKEKRYAIKPNKTNIYEYLSYRNFNNYPNITIDDGYEITEYIEEINIPVEQKMIDLLSTISMLHKKTTYYKKISEFNYKQIYESIKEKIEEAKNVYDELISRAENTIYMSPSEYLLARNISIVYSNIKYSSDNLEKWYKQIKEIDKIRVSVIHNNLKLEHYLNNTLISWDNAKIGIPVFDLYHLYQNTYNEYDWFELLNIYTDNYPLKNEELKLFFILITIPLLPSITVIEVDNVKDINNKLNYIKLTNKFVFTKINEIKIENEI